MPPFHYFLRIHPERTVALIQILPETLLFKSEARLEGTWIALNEDIDHTAMLCTVDQTEVFALIIDARDELPSLHVVVPKTSDKPDRAILESILISYEGDLSYLSESKLKTDWFSGNLQLNSRVTVTLRSKMIGHRKVSAVDVTVSDQSHHSAEHPSITHDENKYLLARSQREDERHFMKRLIKEKLGTDAQSTK